MQQFDYLTTGPRMDLLPARALQHHGGLNTLHVDVVVPRPLATLASHGSLGQKVAHRQRILADVPSDKIRQHPEFFALLRLRSELLNRDISVRGIDSLWTRRLRSIAASCASPFVCGSQWTSLELFDTPRAWRIMEQFSPPWSIERALLMSEAKSFPGWEQPAWSEPNRRQRDATRWADERAQREWDLADIVWAPTDNVVERSSAAGADRAKFRVVPYPIPQLPEGMRKLREPSAAAQPLRVVFAGTLCLLKGVHHLYQAFRSWRPAGIDLHFYGPSDLTSEGLARLSEIGVVHGAVPRTTLLHEFMRADVLLFPSLSEGSALVTLEATATGLPVVSTNEAGAPANAMKIPAGSAGAIRAAMESILDDRAVLARLSAAALGEADRRTQEAFSDEFATLVGTSVAGTR